jgi:uncharacterized membrane protein
LWGLGYDQWQTIQFGMVAALALGILIHLMLHWSWVCGVIATRLARDKKAKLTMAHKRFTAWASSS